MQNVQVLEISINKLQDLYQSILRVGFSRKKWFLKREVMRDYVKGRFLKNRHLRVENQRFHAQDLGNISRLSDWL